MIQTLAIDSFYFEAGAQKNSFIIASFFDDVTFSLAVWLFGALMLETAMDLERLLIKNKGEQQTLLDTSQCEKMKRRKKRFRVSNIIVSCLILLFNIPGLFAYMDDLNAHFSRATRALFSNMSIVGQSMIVVTATIFMIITLRKLYVVAKQTKQKELNLCLAYLWFINSFIICVCYLIIFCTYAIYMSDSSDQQSLLIITAMSMACINAIFVNSCIMVMILFRSAQVAESKHETLMESDKSFRKFLDSFQAGSFVSQSDRQLSMANNSLPEVNVRS